MPPTEIKGTIDIYPLSEQELMIHLSAMIRVHANSVYDPRSSVFRLQRGPSEPDRPELHMGPTTD
jgi:hypothetical protein